MTQNTQNQAELRDRFGRQITYLRLSVTDRCDFRCVYCMAEEMTFLPRAQLCTLEELAEIGRAFAELGVTKIRVTGGEPLVRKNVVELFRCLDELGPQVDVNITTNGSHLKKYAGDLKAAGVKRINVSLDSLNPERFRQLTRSGDLTQVLAGLQAAKRQGFNAIKLNAVVMRNRNLDEVNSLAEFAIQQGFDISFIEEMPLGQIDEHGRKEEFVASAEILDILRGQLSLQSIDHNSGGPSRYYQVTGSQSKIGFISPHSDNFCASCNRVRVSAEGKLLLCLGNEHATDLKAIIRAHPGNREKLKQAIVEAMTIKPERHHFNHDEVQIVRFMNSTGG